MGMSILCANRLGLVWVWLLGLVLFVCWHVGVLFFGTSLAESWDVSESERLNFRYAWASSGGNR